MGKSWRGFFSQMILSPQQAMYQAIEYAKKGVGFVAPNPPVGCVILDSQNKLLSCGYHSGLGKDHAEVSALKKIKDKKKLKNASIFITLEPCCHQGKTPACAQTLARYPFKKLIYGSTDPFTKKKGLKLLQNKGIDVTKSVYYKDELESLIEHFKFSYIHKKPFVSVKVATSLDAIMSLNKKRSSRKITHLKSRKYVHVLRMQHGAILIGVNTLKKDNPRLNIRLKKIKIKNKVIILDPHGQSVSFLLQSRLLKTHLQKNIFIFCSQIPTVPFGLKAIQWRQMKFRKNSFVLSALLKKLYDEEGITSLLVEGGAFCISQFLQQKMVQRLYWHVAPRILGSGLHFAEYFKAKSLSQAPFVDKIQVKSLFPDLILEGNLKFFNR